MHHEQSETIEQDGGYVNVYGRNTSRAGQPLPKRYKFEKDVYPTVKAAVHAARKRSEAEGRRFRSGESQEPEHRRD